MKPIDMQNLTRRFWSGESQGVLEVVDIEAAMKITKFTKPSLYSIINREEFPSPVAKMGKRLFWRRDDVEHWSQVRKSADVSLR